MKNILSAVLFSTVLSLFGYCQNNSTATLLQNDLRNWYPISVRLNDITQLLTEDKRYLEVFASKIVVQDPSTKTVPFDTIIKVLPCKTSKGSVASIPSVQYLIQEGYCSGIMYLDSVKNLNKWKAIMKSSRRVENNHYVINNTLHFRFCLFLKEGLVNILIDEGVQ